MIQDLENNFSVVVEKNKKSMSLRMKFQSDERTLKDEEVDIVINKIVDKLKNKFNAIQR